MGYIFHGIHVLLICVFSTASNFAKIIMFFWKNVAFRSISVSILNLSPVLTIMVVLGDTLTWWTKMPGRLWKGSNDFHRKEVLMMTWCLSRRYFANCRQFWKLSKIIKINYFEQLTFRAKAIIAVDIILTNSTIQAGSWITLIHFCFTVLAWKPCKWSKISFDFLCHYVCY